MPAERLAALSYTVCRLHSCAWDRPRASPRGRQWGFSLQSSGTGSATGAWRSPWGLVLGGRLQVLLDALVVMHLRGHWDGDGRATPAAGKRAGPPACGAMWWRVTGRGTGLTPRPKGPAHTQCCRHQAPEVHTSPLPLPAPRWLLVGASHGTHRGSGGRTAWQGQLWEPTPPTLQAQGADGAGLQWVP